MSAHASLMRKPAGGASSRQRTCRCGRAAGPDGECEECKKKRLQTKLAVGSSNDPLEFEADRVADRVLAFSPPPAACPAPVRVQRVAARADDETALAPDSVDRTLAGPGRPLDPALRHDMEGRFGHDFSRVRVHTGPAAERSSADVNARAYTAGSAIVFGAGQFAPHTDTGRRLLAHELTHVVQQSGADGFPAGRQPGFPGAAFSSPAPWGAGAAFAPFRSIGGPGVRLQRAPAPPKPVTPPNTAAIQARLEAIIRTGGEVPTDTRVVGAAIVEVEGEGYKGPRERRAISSMATDELGHGAPVPHDVTPNQRDFSATRSIAGSGARREFPFSHVNDAEMKLFEGIAKDLSPGAKGTLHFMTMRVRQVNGVTVFEPYPACSGCTRASFEVAGQFPNMKVASYAPSYPTGTLDLGSAGSKGAAPSPVLKPNVDDPLNAKGSAAPNTINPPPETTAPTELPPAKLPDAKLKSPGTGRKIPVLEEGDFLEGRPIRPPLSSGRVGRIGMAAAEGAAMVLLDVVLLATQLVIEFIILPILEKWMQELEEKQRQHLQKKIQDDFDKYQSRYINRTLRNCYLKKIRAAEAAGKKLYVKLDLKVRVEDSSDRFQPLNKSLPESLFDLDIDSTDASNISVVDTPVKPTANDLACVASCGLLDEGPSKPLGGNPIWERTITFSFAAPSSEALLKEFPPQPGENLDAACAGCFIATACYGSALAPEVDTLRRFRDRRLMAKRAGRAFVRAYYLTSPPVARWLERHDACRGTVRRCLVAPLVRVVKRNGWDR